MKEIIKKTKIINTRVPEALWNDINHVIDKGYWTCQSDFVRDAIRTYLLSLRLLDKELDIPISQ